MTPTHPSANDSGLNLDHLEALPMPDLRFHAEFRRGYAAAKGDMLELARAALANQSAPTVPAGYGTPCELRVNGEWVPARFIAVDLVGAEPIVQRQHAMPLFATWDEVRGVKKPALAHQPAQEQAEPVAWMNPHETFAPDAFLWKYDAGHPLYSVPVYRAAQQEPVAAPQQAGSSKDVAVVGWEQRINAVAPALRVKTKEQAMEAEITAWRELAPQQAAAPGEQLWLATLRACGELPEGYEVRIELENGCGMAVWYDAEGERHVIEGEGYLSDDVNEAVDLAIQRAAAPKGGA